MKQFVKALYKGNNCFKYVYEYFLGLSEEKLKAGIFDESQIRKMKNGKQFV